MSSLVRSLEGDILRAEQYALIFEMWLLFENEGCQ